MNTVASEFTFKAQSSSSECSEGEAGQSAKTVLNDGHRKAHQGKLNEVGSMQNDVIGPLQDGASDKLSKFTLSKKKNRGEGLRGENKVRPLQGGANFVAPGYTEGDGLGAEIVGIFVLLYMFSHYAMNFLADVYTNSSGACAAFVSNVDDKNDKIVQFLNASYHLPTWSVSILPDCMNVVFNTTKVCRVEELENVN
ncbi:hypothetical protein Fmac_009458 [Flemingia macrophylla]|uniref:Beta-galactosidase beta-sandwich domain-containing protein n=1 Tax=Flemingia macrophylla TaxID=520843 RepID=A0ABD1N0A4_9FABA